MANTFKVVTKAGVTSEDIIYTVASSTTTVILGLVLGNTTSSQTTVTATVFKGNIDAVDGDFDGTLEADAITVNGTALNTVIADEATALAIALG